MESVIKKIQETREESSKYRANANIKEMLIDGCRVRLRFDPVGDSKVLPVIQAALLSAHLESELAASAGGESA